MKKEDPMRMAMQKLLRKIPFTSKPRIEEMLANDDFTKYTQDDLDYFEDILVQCSEDKCKDMIRSYFKVLSGLAKKSSGDGFFGRIIGVFKRMLQSTSGTDKKHEEDVAAPSKKRRRRSSVGISKRVKRQDTQDSAIGIAENRGVCVDDINASAGHTIRDSSTNASEYVYQEHPQNARGQRRTMSYGYCPEDLVGKPISPDLFTRALNPEYNFLPGLPKLVLGDIPTDEEEEYFRNKEYLNSFDDDDGERCNFNDGKPYNCKKCAEKEYVEKIESLGLLGRDAGLLYVVADGRYMYADDEKKEDVHSIQEKRRRIIGKYYVDWNIKTDAPSAADNFVCESNVGEAFEAHTGTKNAVDNVLGEAGAIEVERPSLYHAVDEIDGEGKNTTKGYDVVAQTGHIPFSGEKADEKEKAHILGPVGSAASKITPVTPDSSDSHKRQEINTSWLKNVPNTTHVEAQPPCSISTGATLEFTPLKMQFEQVGPLSPLLSTEVLKSDLNVSPSFNPESAPLSGVPDITLPTEGHMTSSYISGAIEKDTKHGIGGQQEHIDISWGLQRTTATQGAEGPSSVAVPYCWDSAIATYKKSTGDNSPAKKRGIQTMQSSNSVVEAATFVSQKDNQSRIPFSYTQGGAMAKVSFLSNTVPLEKAFDSGRALEAKSESTYSAHVPVGSHEGHAEAGHQGIPSFVNLFDTSALSAATNQPFMPPGNLFGNPNDEASRPSREGQDVASRFNRRKR